jgi:GntR family transcriptional regulator / MocR family aminotransferase
LPCLLGRQSHDQLLPTTYRPLPAQAGLHLAVSGPSDPADPDLAAALRQHGLLVSSLRRTYAFSPPSAGLLLGFTGLPAPLVVPAVRALSSALAVVGR